MANKENNNDMLSFEELRKQLGIEGDLPKLEEEDTDISALLDEISNIREPEIVTEEKTVETLPVREGKAVTENGKTFIDITDQYTSKEEPVVEEKKETVAPVVKKKRIRTFNEIFADFFKTFIPVKSDSNKEKVRKVVMDFSIIAIICCAVAFGKYFIEYQQQLSTEEDLRGQLVNTDKLSENQYVEAWQDVFAQYPDVMFPQGMDLKYSYLYAINQDLVGWLKIGNTSLDVQLVQSNDNEYYLNRDFYKNKSRYGCPYLDYKNDTRELDDNTIVYGHHMQDGLMFSNLDRYKKIEGYKEAPTIEFSTLYETYTFKVFAAFLSSSNPAADGEFNFMITDFTSDAKFTDFINEVKLRSIFNADVSVQTDDKIITLVTCAHDFDDARLVVMGRMVRENESPSVNTNAATLNTSPKYPQAWYDKKGIKNPYAE